MTENLSYTQFLMKKQQLVMAQPDLPSDFDVIVIGTGLEESIIAASASRNGHTVLHIDTKDYYGDSWTAFNFRSIQEWIISSNEDIPVNELAVKEMMLDGEQVHLVKPCHAITDINEQWFVADEDNSTELPSEQDSSEATKEQAENDDPKEGIESLPSNPNFAKSDEELDEVIEENFKEVLTLPKKPRWTRSKLIQERMFNLDLTPRLLYSRGAMVDLLIQSNISRYTEFKSVSRVLTVLNGALEHVPSSRADVFSTKHVSVVEKRILMKYLTFCLNFQDQPQVYENFLQRSYHDFLKHEKLTDNLIHFVIHSIAMVDKSASTLDGLKATQKFLSSLGRFGNTPFLYSSFGSGELPQAFCRLCAVFGGTYYLGRSIEAVITDSSGENCLGIISGGKRINCKKLVMSGQQCPDTLKQVDDIPTAEVIERKICLTTHSMMPSEKEQLTFLSIYNEESGGYTYVTEVGHGAAVCPRGMYCLHLTKAAHDKEALDEALKIILPDQDKLLWSLDFKINTQVFKSKIESIFLTSGPHFELDYDQTINAAHELYISMFPTDPFLPRAPDPEEIILGEPEGVDEEGGQIEDNPQEDNREGTSSAN